MTSITLNVTGARIQASVNGPLTSGMVGIPVTIQYDNAWNGLAKNFVCRCGKWESDNGEIRTILGIGETATVAHEVMQANKHLYLGVEGYSTDGKLVMPTTWADCGVILYGANTGEDPSTDPELSVWAQLQAEIEQIKQDTAIEEDIAAAVAAYLEENPIEIPDSSQNGNSGTTSPLYGKKILVIGDSFVRGALSEDKEWVSKIASRNNMTAYNYGSSGSPLAYASVQTYPAIVTKLSTITEQVESVDYVVLLAGHNDANPDINGGSAIPIGENTDTVNTTFKGALNITINTLLDAYPTARILFLTPFNRRGIEEPYAEAMKEICGIWCIPCFDNYHSSGICFQNDAQAEVYDLNNSLHLNEAGQERISELYESLLANNLPISYSLGGEVTVSDTEQDGTQNSGAQFTFIQMEKSAYEALTSKDTGTVYLVNGYGVFVGATCIVSSDMMDSSTQEPDPGATLESISAVYSGGDVAAGTAVTDLTGIVVTATYSDNSTEIVTDYTLSGTIAEGNNTITVSYGGKATTFIVTGLVSQNYITNSVDQWNYPKEADGFTVSRFNRAVTQFTLSIGDIVDFVNADLWNTYKYAIGEGDYSVSMTFIGGGYQSGGYTITEAGNYCIMVARLDDADIDEAEMAVIADSFGYISASSGN